MSMWKQMWSAESDNILQQEDSTIKHLIDKHTWQLNKMDCLAADLESSATKISDQFANFQDTDRIQQTEILNAQLELNSSE